MKSLFPVHSSIMKSSEKRRYNVNIAMLSDKKYDRYVECGISLLFNQLIPKPD